MPKRPRRAVLASIGTAAATALAGCSSTSNNSDSPENGDTTAATNTSMSTQSPNADVFEAVEPTTGSLPTENEEGAVLDVALTDTSISAIALRNSDGNEVARRELGTGNSTQLPLTGLEAGTFDVVAVKGGNIVGEQSVALERSYEVESVSFTEISAISADPKIANRIQVAVTNTGDLPVAVSSFRTVEGVPSPTPDDQHPFPFIDSGQSNPPVWNPGETRKMKTSGRVLLSESREGPTTDAKTAIVEVTPKQGVTKALTIDYSLSGEVYSGGGIYGRPNSTISGWSVNEP